MTPKIEKLIAELEEKVMDIVRAADKGDDKLYGHLSAELISKHIPEALTELNNDWQKRVKSIEDFKVFDNGKLPPEEQRINDLIDEMVDSLLNEDPNNPTSLLVKGRNEE